MSHRRGLRLWFRSAPRRRQDGRLRSLTWRKSAGLIEVLEIRRLLASVSLVPTDDSFVDSFSTTQNFGTLEFVDVGYCADCTAHTRWWSYFRFNLSSIPADAIINSATLRLYKRPEGTPPQGDLYFYLANTDN
jgi:hypothetical protein